MPSLEKYTPIFLFITSFIGYYFFAYFTERTSFYQLITLWSLLCLCFYFLQKKNTFSIRSLIIIGVLFRLIFLFAYPTLSQDFYRFIWDGRMIFEGFNPYISTPETHINAGSFIVNDASLLYDGMGVLNGSHYTNYPPLNQLCFLIAAYFGNQSVFNSIIVLRLIIMLADIGILFYGRKLLNNLNIPEKNIFWYFLHPFIIIEMTGNLHFEPVMMFFLIASLYYLHKQKWVIAGILVACSVSVKLIPLLFLPIFYQWFVRGKQFFLKEIYTLLLFYFIVIGGSILLFLPFLDTELITNYSSSVGLWFRRFEFNASFYYIFREIGYWFRGYNEIAIIGKIMPVITILFLIIISFLKKQKTFTDFITSMLFGICFYYFMSTTVHPWYIATPLILSVFTSYRFASVWAFVVIISYAAYANNPWKENLSLVALQYLIVFGILLWEVFQKNKEKKIVH